MAGLKNLHFHDDEETNEGMTDAQYKGMLLDQKYVWEDLLVLALKGDKESIKQKAQRQIEIITEKLRY